GGHRRAGRRCRVAVLAAGADAGPAHWLRPPAAVIPAGQAGGPARARAAHVPRGLRCGFVEAYPPAPLKLPAQSQRGAGLNRLDHRRRTLPENAEVEAAQQRDAELRDGLAALEARDSDLTREQAKAERDVDQVRSRIERDRARLDAGQVSSPKELENL